MKNKNILGIIKYWSSVAIIGVIFGFSIQFVSAWVNPPAGAPASNVGAPITTGSMDQSKAGLIATNGLAAGREAYPPYWGGGVNTWDLQAGGTILSKHDVVAMGAFKMNYHTINSNANGWLYIGDQNGAVYGGRGLAADSLWANYRMHTPELCLSGDCRSKWPDGGSGSSVPTPPVCVGERQALQWTGSSWRCQTIPRALDNCESIGLESVCTGGGGS